MDEWLVKCRDGSSLYYFENNVLYKNCIAVKCLCLMFVKNVQVSFIILYLNLQHVTYFSSSITAVLLMQFNNSISYFRFLFGHNWLHPDKQQITLLWQAILLKLVNSLQSGSVSSTVNIQLDNVWN